MIQVLLKSFYLIEVIRMIGKLFKKHKTIEIKNIKTTSRYNDISADMYDKCKFCGDIIFKEDFFLKKVKKH